MRAPVAAQKPSYLAVIVFMLMGTYQVMKLCGYRLSARGFR